MDMLDTLNHYEDIKGYIKFVTTSSVRTKIILSLNKGNKDLNIIKNELDLESSAALHSLKKLESQNIIIKKETEYSLSSLGKLYAVKLKNLFKSCYTIKKYEKIWLDHCLDGIPKKLLKEVKCLNNSFLVESTPTDIIRPHSHYTELINKAHKIKCISPIFYYPYIDIYKNALDRNAKVELILTPLILAKIVETAGVTILNDILASQNFKLYQINEDVKIALTVTENFLSIGLFSTEGLYDATINLISYDADAIKWGNKLFNYYLNNARTFTLDNLNK
jgi:predicted transcriptional regulator